MKRSEMVQKISETIESLFYKRFVRDCPPATPTMFGEIQFKVSTILIEQISEAALDAAEKAGLRPTSGYDYLSPDGTIKEGRRLISWDNE